MKKSIVAVLAGMLFALGPNAMSQTVPAELNRMLAACSTNNQFNGVCLALENETPVFCQAFGYQDLASKTINNKETAFEIASITKPFTATAILMLAKEGKLKLTDDVSKFIPGWPYSEITVYHLLTHTSGLPDYRFLFTGWDPNRTASNADLIQLLVDKKPGCQFPAGEGWNYSNTGYAILASIIERACGTNYSAFLNERIFSPLQMTRSGVWPQKTTNQAAGHLLTRKGYVSWSMDRHLQGIVGDGGVFTTARDLARFAEALFSEKLLGNLTKEMLVPVQIKNGGYQHNGIGSGLGLHLKFREGSPTPIEAFHPGNYGGFRAVLWRDLEKNRTLIIIDNCSHNLDEISTAAQNIMQHKSWQMPGISICDAMLSKISTDGIDGALAFYKNIKKSGASGYLSSERELNTLGYLLLRDAAVDDAIKIFQLNTQEYPNSFNAFDSLAEAWLQKGNTREAILAYEQAVKLNPGYRDGIEALKRLRKDQSAD